MTSKITHLLPKAKMKEVLLFFGMPMVTIFGLSVLVAVKISADLRLDSFFSVLVFLFVLLMGNMLFVIFQILMMELSRMLLSHDSRVGRNDKRKDHRYDKKRHIYNNECSELVLEDARQMSSIGVEEAESVDKTGTEQACVAMESNMPETGSIPQSAHVTPSFPLFNNEAYSKRYAEAERQRERRKAERQKAISEYILHTMSPYTAPDELAVLHDELTAWMLDPAHKPKPVNLRDRRLTTMDLRHFIWNIAERLDDSRSYNGHNRAVFTKALFPETFVDTEIDSIRNFTVNPDSGLIRIDRPDKGSFKFHYDDTTMAARTHQ